ncbi:MAG: hypothetical protein ABIH72_05835 [archaeon]
MNKFFKFIIIGILFATVAEFVLNILILKNINSYLFTFIIYFTLLTFAYFLGKIINKIRKPYSEILYYIIASTFGLMFEWFLLGNAPWLNLDANQIGMFSFWAAVFMMPRIFCLKNENLNKLKKYIKVYFIIYAIILILLGFIIPESSKIFILTLVITLGYTIMNVFYLWFFIK